MAQTERKESLNEASFNPAPSKSREDWVDLANNIL